MYQLTGTQSYHDTFAGEKFSKFIKFLRFSNFMENWPIIFKQIWWIFETAPPWHQQDSHGMINGDLPDMQVIMHSFTLLIIQNRFHTLITRDLFWFSTLYDSNLPQVGCDVNQTVKLDYFWKRIKVGNTADQATNKAFAKVTVLLLKTYASLHLRQAYKPRSYFA